MEENWKMEIKSWEQRYECIVVGGGTAGFAAAVTAAKSGVKTLLIEERGSLGGTATGARIGQLMGFAAGEDKAEKKGIVKEILERLMSEGGSNGIETIYLCGNPDLDVAVIPYDPEIMKNVMEDMVFESGADVLLHTRVIGTETNGSKIEAVLIHNQEGIQRIYADTVIDASFHASVAADAGCRWKAGNEKGQLQPGTLMYEMGGVDAERWAKVPQKEKRELAEQGLKEGCLYVNNLLARPLPNGIYYCNMSRIQVNPLDTLQWSRAEYEARKQVKGISRFFQEHVPGFEQAHLTATGEFTGLRDSRRIMGNYVLTNEDVLNGTEFEDAVAKSSYPIDIHDTNGVSSTIIKPKTGVFFIPYRSMVTDACKNLILAGRCISTEYEAHACIRVMITCIRLGEAAGRAAYYCREQGVDAASLDGRILKQELL